MILRNKIIIFCHHYNIKTTSRPPHSAPPHGLQAKKKKLQKEKHTIPKIIRKKLAQPQKEKSTVP